jgi:hypothetical protein
LPTIKYTQEFTETQLNLQRLYELYVKEFTFSIQFLQLTSMLHSTNPRRKSVICLKHEKIKQHMLKQTQRTIATMLGFIKSWQQKKQETR